MVMTDPAARAAIESAKTWDIKKGNPAMTPGQHGLIPDPANEFWAVQLKFKIVETLATGFGSESGDYVFDFSSLASHKPTGIRY